MKPYAEYKETGLDWLPLAPGHWELKKGKRIFQRVVRDVRPNDEVVTAFRDGQVTLRKNRRLAGFTESNKEIGYQGIRKGDLVIHAMDAFAGAIGVSDSDGKSTPVYSACIAVNDDDPYYFAQLLRFVSKTGYLQALAKGIRERSTDFRYEQFANLRFIVPPLDEQKRIVSYLAVKNREIESYIAAKRKLLERLKELSAAVISRAVTQGLKPAVENKAFHASGYNWLTEIPCHWEVKKLFWCVSMRSGDTITSEQIETEGAFPVYGGNGFRGYTTIYNQEGFHALIGRQGALCGNINYADGNFFASEHAIVVKHRRKNQLHPVYLGELLRTMNLGQYSVSAAQPGLAIERIANLRIPIPPLKEQETIVAFIENQLTTIRDAQSRIEREIELARELWTTLVAEVVTGQVDVSDWSGPDVTDTWSSENLETEEEAFDEEAVFSEE